MIPGSRSPPPRPTRFPILWVGAAVILALLIVLTPVLFANSASLGGSLLAQAVLVVDKTPTGSTLHFNVQGIGTVRYSNLSIGLATNYDWNHPTPIRQLDWSSWTNGTDLIGLAASSSAGTVVVNVSADYAPAGSSSTWYVGIVAVEITGGTIQFRSLTPGLSVASSLSVSDDLPTSIALVNAGGSGPAGVAA